MTVEAIDDAVYGQHWLDDSPTRWQARSAARRALTDVVRPLMRRRLRRLAVRTPRLHLGCGDTRLHGWVNIDLVGHARVDVAINLQREVPLADGSIEAIYHEHVLEHLTYAEARILMAESARLLKPGGVLRMGVPDFGRYVLSYAGQDDFLESNRPGRPSTLLALAEVAYAHGHRSVWDRTTLLNFAADVGLVAEQKVAGESRLLDCPDRRHRESLYVEAVKAFSREAT